VRSSIQLAKKGFPISARLGLGRWDALSGYFWRHYYPKRQFKKRHIPTGGVRPSHADIERNKFF